MRLSKSKADVGEFKTLEGGHTIRMSVNDQDLPPLNQPCILAIRPEHVLISNSDAQQENALRANVLEINFAGATSSIKLDANGLVIEALTLEANGLVAGDRCTALLPPDRIALLRDG